jgi:hypothetical protein
MKTLLVMAALAMAGCAKKEEPVANQRPAPMAEAERTRAVNACDGYVKAACACAEKKPDDAALVKRCSLDKALPEAFQLTLSVDDDPAAPAADVLRAQDQARKIVKSCLEGVNELAAKGCPP